MQIKGQFEVSIEPCSDKKIDVGRMQLDKQYSGTLQAHSLGQMLSHRSSTEGSAGYVALERVEGTLNGKEGSFVLVHMGLMSQGQQQLEIKVVPDSGTNELAGLSGTMDILIEEGQHFYQFDYQIGS